MNFKTLKWICIFVSSIVIAILWPMLSQMFGPSLSHVLPKQLVGEQCSSVWIKPNMTSLKSSLDSNVFGQHIASRLVLGGLQRRWTIPDYQPEKPLVMSFHGWTGSGKNYVAKFIAEAIYELGMESKYVTFISSTLLFRDPSKVHDYQGQLQNWIKSKVATCSQTLVIIDEIDKMPPGVLDGLKPYMDYHEKVDGVDFRRTIFILLSNTGGKAITNVTMEFWKSGKSRESMTNFDLEGLISLGAYNEEGGFQHTSLIDRSLIDYHVPFLPLESRHVRRCINKELENRNLKSSEEIVDKVVKQLPFWPKNVNIFSTSGCKRIIQKLDEILFDDL